MHRTIFLIGSNFRINKDVLYVTAVKPVCIACSNLTTIHINSLIYAFYRNIMSLDVLEKSLMNINQSTDITIRL